MTEMTPKEVAISLVKDGEEAEQILLKVLRAFGIELLRNIVKTTPVDTGRARANWITSLNTPSELTFKEDALVVPDNITDKEYFAMVREYFAKVKIQNDTDAISLLNSVKLEQLIFLSNNLAYISRLNEGSSKQAPAKFVEIAAEKVENEIPNIVKGFI